MNPMTKDNSNDDAVTREAITGILMLVGFDGLGGSGLGDVRG